MRSGLRAGAHPGLMDDTTAGDTGKVGLSRRSMIRRAAAAGAIAWSAPVILDSLTSPAAAATACTGFCYRFGIQATASSKGNCDVNSPDLSAKPTACQPSAACAKPLTPGAVSKSYLPYYGFTYVSSGTDASQNGCTISGTTCTGGTATGQCWVPNNATGGENVSVKRVFDFDVSVFNSRFGTNPPGTGTCLNAALYSAVGGHGGDTGAESCCGVSDYGTGKAAGAPACGGNSYAKSTTISATVVRIEFGMDGALRSKAGQSGTYQFTVGCDCV